MQYPTSSTAKVYYDLDGNPRTLRQMVANESEWAVSRIQEGEKAIAHRNQLREALECWPLTELMGMVEDSGDAQMLERLLWFSEVRDVALKATEGSDVSTGA